MNDFNNMNNQGENTPSAANQSGNYAPPSGMPVASGNTGSNPQANPSNNAESIPVGAVHQSTGASVPTSQPAGNSGPMPPVGAPSMSGAKPTTQIPRTATPGAAAATPMNANQVIYGKPKASGSASGKTFLIAFAGALVACVLAFGAMFAFGAFGSDPGKSVTIGASNTSSINASDVDATLPEAVASACLPSVVSIDVLGTQSSNSGSSLYDYLYGYGQDGSQSDDLSEVGLGSGVIISDDGYIITNHHVIDGGKKFNVTVGGDQREAELVGSDSSSDVAVLKIKDGSGFTPIKIGDSANIKIGEWVMSIGSPFGLEQSVATGIVSATSRSQIMDAETDAFGQSTGDVTIYPNMIQTDAAINPGNSGGALVNANGELIGINTLITSYSGNYSGVGFAIPSNYAINIAQSLIAGKEPTRAFLGVSMTTINSSIAQMYGFATNSGAYISGVEPDSAAAKAGLEVGDIITAFDGQQVTSASDLTLDVRTKNPGDKVTLTIVRDGNEQNVEVTLGQSQDSQSSNSQNNNQKDRNSGRNSNSQSPFGR